MFKRLPHHLGIIPVGNRRWAQERGFEKREGYAHGLGPGVDLFERLVEAGVQEATFYGFTRDNTKRAKDQREAFTKACVQAVGLVSNRDANIFVAGNTESASFPAELLPYTRERVRYGKGIINLNFLVNYDWEWDLKTALTTGKIATHLIPRIDLIIRWGGRRRLSGFLPVQSVYADFYIINDYWPDYRGEHLSEALSWYQDCDVTLGG